jgi:putative polyketide hydroxylase
MKPSNLSPTNVSEYVDVLVIGAGPVGLTAALLLARYGLSVKVVERHRTTSQHPRATSLNFRTMEIFRSVGLEEEVRTAGMPLQLNRFFLWTETMAGRELRRVDARAVEDSGLDRLSPCRFCNCAQDALEPVLVRRLTEYDQVNLCFATEVTALEWDGQGITAAIQESSAVGSNRTVRAKYAVAADGPRSPTRSRLGIGTGGAGDFARVHSILFKADLFPLVADRPCIICFVSNPAIPFGLLVPADNRKRWVLMVPNMSGDAPPASDRRWDELIRLAVGVPDLPFEVVSVLDWTMGAMIADQFGKPPLLLAGDAVHVMPPSGGFGLNTGLHDAHNLAWKVAAMVQGWGGGDLIDSYEVERRPIDSFIVDHAMQRLRQQAGATDLAPPLALFGGYQYGGSSVIEWDAEPPRAGPWEGEPRWNADGRPGARAPHSWLRRDSYRISTLDLFDGRSVLLTSSESHDLAEPASAIASSHGIPLDIVEIGPGGDLLDDSRNDPWQTAFGISPDGGTLVRPDGFVAWRSHTKPTPQQFESALLRMAGRAPSQASRLHSMTDQPVGVVATSVRHNPVAE